MEIEITAGLAKSCRKHLFVYIKRKGYEIKISIPSIERLDRDSFWRNGFLCVQEFEPVAQF